MPKLYHAIFGNDYRDVSVLDHLLRPVDGGEMTLYSLATLRNKTESP